jgi:hypothetical protein
VVIVFLPSIQYADVIDMPRPNMDRADLGHAPHGDASYWELSRAAMIIVRVASRWITSGRLMPP